MKNNMWVLIVIGAVLAIIFIGLYSTKLVGENGVYHLQTIGQGFLSNYTTRTNVVMQNADEFNSSGVKERYESEYYETAECPRSSTGGKLPCLLAPPPEINFKEKTVIAVFLGQQETGGSSIKVQLIVDEGNKVAVFVKEDILMPENAQTGETYTQPYSIVETEKITKPIVFKNVKTPSEPISSKSEESCKATGGEWVQEGIRQSFGCVHTYSDAGKPCSSSPECKGSCISKDDGTGYCKNDDSPFGCYRTIEDFRSGKGILCTD